MKIEKLSCTQFAGLNNKDIDLKDGINVLYGKNESGKSTLVNLLSRTLFQDVKLTKNRNEDKAFFNSFFPVKKKTSNIAADYIDGEVSIDTKEGKYEIKKKWSLAGKSVSHLSTPNGTQIEDINTINDELANVLQYGEGVYSNILLSSQRGADISLEKVLDENGQINNDLSNILTMAFVEDDSVSINEIEYEIDNKINKLTGEVWDEENKHPKDFKHKNSKAALIKAYYNLDDEKKNIEQLKELEDRLDEANANYQKRSNAHIEAKKKYDDFSKVVTILTSQKSIKDNIEIQKQKLSELEVDSKNWPIDVNNVKKAQELKDEYDNSINYELYVKAKELNEEKLKLEAKLVNINCPSNNDIDSLEEAENNVSNLTNSLNSINIKANIEMYNNNSIEIRSLSSGTVLPFTEEMNINEAVRINVPDVMEMKIVPVGIDVDEINKEITKNKKIVNSIYSKYNVENVKQLRELLSAYNETKHSLDILTNNLDNLLDGKDYRDLEELVNNITNKPRESSLIEKEIKKICENGDINSYIVLNKERINTLETKYSTKDNLDLLILETKNTIETERKSIIKNTTKSKEYENIDNPQEYLEQLSLDKEEAYNEYINAVSDKASVSKEYSMFIEEASADEQIRNKELAEREFNKQLELFHHWKNIKKVFIELKETINDNPLKDLATNFTKYLSALSNNVESQIPSTSKLDINIYSFDRPLDYSKLSEGTKEIVSLAFRLAVLDHLFPKGGGIAVFDDSFVNMDDDRNEKAIDLIKKASKKHQIIFLTCKEEYIKKLGGNLIKI